MKKLLLGLLLLVCSIAQAQPWVVDLTTSSTVTVTNTAEFMTALTNVQAGRKIVLNEGVYSTGQIVLTTPGTPGNVILITANGHATINGTVRIQGAYNYVMGVEITGGAQVGGANQIGTELFCNNCGLINNFIHGINGQVGLLATSSGVNQVIYGNLFGKNISVSNNPHNMYIQNDYDTYGWKYVVGNYSFDAEEVTGMTFTFHGYTEGGQVEGMHVEDNIFEDGRFLIGGTNPNNKKEFVKNNSFYDVGFSIGYSYEAPSQVEDNYFGRSSVKLERVPGEGTSFSEIQTFTGNTIVYPPANKMIVLKTSIGNVQGVAEIDNTTVWNNNLYINPTWGSTLGAEGMFHCCDTSYTGHWLPNTAARGGVNFDTNSTFSTAPATNRVLLRPNAYDDTRALLEVFNWTGATSLEYSQEGGFEVFNAKDPFGTAIVSGTDTVTIPLSGEFQVFLIKKIPCDPAAVREKLNEIQVWLDKLQNKLTGALGDLQEAMELQDKCLEE